MRNIYQLPENQRNQWMNIIHWINVKNTVNRTIRENKRVWDLQVSEGKLLGGYLSGE